MENRITERTKPNTPNLKNHNRNNETTTIEPEKRLAKSNKAQTESDLSNK